MFDTGLLRICELQMVAENGGMPQETLVQKGRAFYGERMVTASRLYEARGVDVQIDKVVRVPFDTKANPDDYVILENGEQFRIDSVDAILIRRDLRAIELTLVKLGENYVVATE